MSEFIIDADGHIMEQHADLFAHIKGDFGDLDWRSVGAVGTGGIHTFENDTGPDEANHDWHGIFVLSTTGGEAPLRGRLPDVSIYDIAPTLLRLMEQPVPDVLAGAPLP